MAASGHAPDTFFGLAPSWQGTPQPNLHMPGHSGRIGVGAPGWKEQKLVIFLAQCRKECGHCTFVGV